MTVPQQYRVIVLSTNRTVFIIIMASLCLSKPELIDVTTKGNNSNISCFSLPNNSTVYILKLHANL